MQSLSFCLYCISLRYEANLIFCHLRERCIAFPPILFNRSDFWLLGRHDINKTVKNMHLCSCYEKRNLNLHGLINSKYFSNKFLILKFRFSELEQFYSSSSLSLSSEKLFFRVQVRVRAWQNNRVFSSLSSSSSWSSQPCQNAMERLTAWNMIGTKRLTAK